jgi:hypothetical protein
MSRDDIQKLLGGYATGTLTAEEQRALYQAALEDQELFDALAREEALREVLSDPSARAHLLAAMDEAPAPWYRQWWRPMVVVAAALLMVAGVAVWQSARTPRPRRMAKLELPPLPAAEPSKGAPVLPPPPELARAAPPALAPFPLPAAMPAGPPPPPASAAPAAKPPQVEAAAAPLASDQAVAVSNGALGMQQARSQTGARFVPTVNGLVAGNNAALQGVVTDATGAPVRSANVTVKSLATGESVTASTDERGAFRAPEVPGTTYQISAAAPGFRTATMTEITPDFGAPEPVNLKLDVGATAEAVGVVGGIGGAAPLFTRAGDARGGRGGGGGAMARKATPAPASPPLQYQLLSRMPGGGLVEVGADGTAPAGAAIVLRVTPTADGRVRIVQSTGRTIANHAVQSGKTFETRLLNFKPGRVELQVYLPAERQTPVTITFNIQ